MSDLIGIEAMKAAALAVIQFGEKVQAATADQHVSWAEGISLAIGSLPDVYSIARSGKQLKAEYQDLSDLEREELVEYVVDNVELHNEHLEEKIEKGFIALVAVEDFFSEFKKADPETEEPV